MHTSNQIPAAVTARRRPVCEILQRQMFYVINFVFPLLTIFFSYCYFHFTFKIAAKISQLILFAISF